MVYENSVDPSLWAHNIYFALNIANANANSNSITDVSVSDSATAHTKIYK